jgi:hypothetical protein
MSELEQTTESKEVTADDIMNMPIEEMEKHLPKTDEEAQQFIEEQPEEVQTEESTTESSTEEQPEKVEKETIDPLATTPFKDVKSMVDSYKELQGRDTRNSQEIARLREQSDQYEEIIANEPEPVSEIEEEFEEPEFLTKKEVEKQTLDLIAKRDNEAYEKATKDARINQIDQQIAEARSTEGFNENDSMEFIRANPGIDNTMVDNPLLLADTIMKEGLHTVYKDDPGMFSLKDGGLSMARSVLKGKSTPQEINETAKEKAVEEIKKRIIDDQSMTAQSSQKAEKPPTQNYQEMDLDELKATPEWKEASKGVPKHYYE